MKVATGLARGPMADPALAAQAVQKAMDKAGLSHPATVLLYLTAEFASAPLGAIAAAARAAGCLQVTGCTAAGVFTEDDWVLDAPAAVAMVLGEGCALRSRHEDDLAVNDHTFTLTAPNALDMLWLERGGQRYGGVSGDATGQGPYSVWTGGREQASGRCDLLLEGARLDIGVSQGIRPLAAPAVVEQVQGHDVCRLGGDTALASLVRELPPTVRAPERIPTHLLMAGLTYGETDNALAEGRFHLLPVVGVKPDDQSVTVAARLDPGQHLFWALRQPQAAEHDMHAMVTRLAAGNLQPPDFALMFPCIGRGPWFYGGQDRDIQTLTRHYPDMPLIGFYGNGEIAHLDGANRLLQYSVVLGLGYGDEAQCEGGRV